MADGEYQVTFERKAEADLIALPKEIRQRVLDQIVLLAKNPRPHGCKKIGGFGSLYRIRQGNYRVLYDVSDKARTVVILGARHRGVIYRLLRYLKGKR